MGDIVTDSAIMAALGRQMSRAVQRQSVAAGNLANLDTPGFRAREVQFSGELDRQLNPGLNGTDPRHFSSTPAADGGTTSEAAGLQARRDGNNVQLDRELLSLGRAAADFTAAQTVLAAKFRLVRYAINEGR